MQEKVEKYIYYVTDNKYRVKFLKVDKKNNTRISFDQYVIGTLEDARKLRDDKLKENGLTLEKEVKDRNDIFTIKELGAAVRRFISRYLIGKKQNDDINEKSLLVPALKRPELWGEKISKIGNLEELIFNLLGDFNLTVGQIFNFYEIIKDEDEKEILYEVLAAEQEQIIQSHRRKIKF